MKSILLSLCILMTLVSKASNYYFSTQTGNDNRTNIEAQNQLTPWQTIDKLNTIILKPGDSVLFKKGEIFSGSLVVNNSGTQGMVIYYGAYGTGANPVISGFASISGWTLLSGNIYYAPLDMPGLNMVTLNNKVQGMGRYPNKGYLSYETHTNNTSITDSQLITTNNWVGAEAVIRKYRWVIDRHTITNQIGKTLFYNALSSYGNNKAYNPVDNNGYFIQNHISTLDSAGEWYYDNLAKRIYMDFTGSTPENNVVKASIKDKNASLTNKSNVSFENLNFEGGNTVGLYFFNCQYITVNNCNFSNEGGVAIYGAPTNNITVQNTSIINSLSNGIYFEYNGHDCTINNVTVNNTNIIAGSGRSGDAVGNGIMIRGNNAIIKKCKVINSGYNGIQFAGNNVVVEKNFIDSFCMIKDDGGGIYTYTGKSTVVNLNQKITDNIILNGKGASEGTNDVFNVPVHGIYLDNNSNNIEINNNTIARNGESAIFVHDSYNLNIINNSIFDNPIGLQMNQDILDSASFIRNNTVKNNVIFSKNDAQTLLVMKSKSNDIKRFSYFDSNFYCRPLSEKAIITTSYNNLGFTSITGQDLPGWKATYNTDSNSFASPIKIPAYSINNYVGSNIYANEYFATKVTSFSQSSRTNNCKLNWVPESGLDSGALNISFVEPVVTNRTALVSLNIGVLSGPKNYILKFSLLGSKPNSSIRVYIKNNNAPYNDLSVRKFCKLTNVRTENELLLSFSGSNAYSSIVFEINEADSALWIDNVKFIEANITSTDPNNYIRFEYNPTDSPTSIWLNDNYVDAKNKNYIGNVVIPAYGSLILIKALNIPVGTYKSLIFTGEKNESNVNLAWDRFNETSTRKFEIEKSNDTLNFKSLGNLSFDIKNPNHIFTDYNPFPGKNYYRIKQFDMEGKYVYSKIILIVFDIVANMSVYPNPTKGDLNVLFNTLSNQTVTTLSIRNMQGIIMKTYALNALDKGLVINTSFLKSGLYLLTHEGTNLMQHSQFIKL